MDRTEDLEKRAFTYRWIIWGVMVLAYMIVFFHRFAAGVVKEELVEAFGLSAASFGSLASMYFYAYMIMQIPVGFMADFLGARKTVACGTFLAGAGSIIFGLAPSSAVIFTGRFLVGIGVSTVFVSILKIQSQWFKEREFATMSGITAFLGSSGGLIAQTPLAALVAIFTWRATFAGIGVISVIIACICYLLIRDKPQDMGLPPINEAQILREGKQKEDTKRISLLSALGQVIGKWQVWPSAIYFGLVTGSYLALAGTWGVPYMQDVYGFEKTEASGYVSLIVYGAMAGGLLIGWISDKMGRRKLPLVVNTAVVALVWAGMSFLNGGKPPLPYLKPMFFLIGFCSTSFILALSIAKETNSPELTGLAVSVLNAGCFAGSALVTTAMGMVMDLSAAYPFTVQYHRAFVLCFAGSLVGLIGSLLLPETGCRNISEDGPR